MTEKELLKAAVDARNQAYVPYSNFPVGAAAVSGTNDVFTGCNIENASYGLSNCAERTAIFKAVSEGNQNVQTLAVVADTDDPVSPCGACRQVLSEFLAPSAKVILGNMKGDMKIVTVHELLPGAFQAEDFQDE
ncbi:cytidine deaminase [Alteribacillus persepolensis]|uniref:Cytidine deaminase n=1 Tax=Alteribacillus persepolensis TaxID=568899 RepID=A0A1G8CQZ8_9BACI|nr:cytidine deaminase [Alteribacillus persepolensis]SDH47878.1 cytidine deaminase [Alteribacillus persepolensis]